MSVDGNVLGTYLESGDPALTGYYPAWLGNLAEGATVERRPAWRKGRRRGGRKGGTHRKR